MVGPGMVAPSGIKVALFTSTILLALVGTVAAEERDPRLKDPTIDFNTVNLSTLPPLQFTFVPEWRKLEGFRRFVAAKPLRRLATPGKEALCESFWADWENKSEKIKVVEPIIQTNIVDELESSPLRSMCPDLSLIFPGYSEDSTGYADFKARYGLRIFDASTDAQKVYVYQKGYFGLGRSVWEKPNTPQELEAMIQNKTNYLERRRGTTILIPEKSCKPRQIASTLTPFMTVDRVADDGYIADDIVLSYEGEFYTLRTYDYIQIGRRIDLMSMEEGGDFGWEICTMYK